MPTKQSKQSAFRAILVRDFCFWSYNTRQSNTDITDPDEYTRINELKYFVYVRIQMTGHKRMESG